MPRSFFVEQAVVLCAKSTAILMCAGGLAGLVWRLASCVTARITTLTLERHTMTTKPLYLIAVVASLVVSVDACAQFGRFGRGSKPDSAALTKAREDSIAKASGDTSATAPAAAPRKRGFSLGGMVSGATSRVVGTIASVAGNVMTGSTADLSTVVPLVYRVSNTWPKSLGTMGTKIIPNWGEGGGDMVTVNFTQRTGGMMSKIDGTVTVDGRPADYATMGVYSALSPASKGTRRVEVTTTTGQKAGFSIPAPRGTLRITSINGQANPETIDVTKDVTIQLAGVTAADTTPIVVKVITSVLGLREFYDAYYVRPGATVTVPAAAFRNLNIAPGNVKAGANLNDSYLLVSREGWVPALDATGEFVGLQIMTSESDGRLFRASPSADMNTGFTAKAELGLPGGKLEYALNKPGAFVSRPITQATTLATISFAVRGKTYLSKSRTTTTSTTRTTETRTLRFPQLPEAVWDAALAELYDALTPVFTQELGATMLPIEPVIATAAYRSLAPFSKDDETTDVQFTHSFKGTTLLSAVVPVSVGYGWNRVDARLLRETGANALLKVTLDLEISEKDGFSMIPTLAFEMTGAPNGHSAATKFVTGTITGAGRPLKKNEPVTPAVLREVMRTSDFAAALRTALKDFKGKEAANRDYQVLWSKR